MSKNLMDFELIIIENGNTQIYNFTFYLKLLDLNLHL